MLIVGEFKCGAAPSKFWTSVYFSW